MTNEEKLEVLKELEFTSGTYSPYCPLCFGDKHDNWGYTEEGPDRGHEEGCKLRAFIDELEGHDD